MVTSTSDFDQIREAYKKAPESKENSERFYELTKQSDHSNPVLLGYYGCAIALKASFANKVWDKLLFFRTGRKLIDKSVASDPDNIELRMIRLSVQHEVPKILGYYGEIEKDKEFILSHINAFSSPELKELIKEFIANSEVFKQR